MKRIVTVQDISCVGKCSLTVALPILSAMGHETAVLPTTLLSTHTAFQGFTFLDLTHEIPPILHHWKSLGLHFDAFYSGYLGSASQADLVTDLLQTFREPGSTVVVDPAMADFGRLYTGLDTAFVPAMRTLCARADVILPNLTEACLLLGIPYEPTPDEIRVGQILRGLTDLGCPAAVLTGVSFAPGQLGAAGFDRRTGRSFAHFGPLFEESFHGTGDVFASVLTGALVGGASLSDATALAVRFTNRCLEVTVNAPDRRWYGVQFETVLPELFPKNSTPTEVPTHE